MILLADSGSTKTHWRYQAADGSISQVMTQGLNPWHMSAASVQEVLTRELVPQVPGPVEQLYFYGSGCTPGQATDQMHDSLKSSFPEASIYVADDLMAAARGLCGKETGIACILGTGSNSCLWNGKQTADRIPALGYVLGDEGSGADLGKRLLHAYYKRALPDGLHASFEKRFKPVLEETLQQVYQSDTPSQYLGGFSRFLLQHVREAWVYRMVYAAFDAFFEHNICRYPDYQQLPVHFTGSVAFYFANVLRQVGNDRGVVIRNIVEEPIAGLMLYHQINTSPST